MIFNVIVVTGYITTCKFIFIGSSGKFEAVKFVWSDIHFIQLGFGVLLHIFIITKLFAVNSRTI
ncbi:Uncharacterised protein [Shigella sonnei]|nr:Uncharacterised protein [Shigella sonnei]CSF82141.1 Uncharacterised protein [Shigella sonnei]CSG15452.1 Uncharacterised protein [Shigella sonnei]CSI32571.1 Uncharacterised protein [Shigella sonnei]CSQ45649.1 Uncharacterised protein [Shigella sonnei]